MSDDGVFFVEHGDGLPVIVLHGAMVDHRDIESCFEDALAGRDGYRRIYPDLPGMGRTPAAPDLRSAAGVVDLLVAFVERVADGPVLLAGHSAGAYFARAMAARLGPRVAGLALVCPLLGTEGDVPAARAVVETATSDDDGFAGYFVLRTAEMLERYERFTAPGAALADGDALARLMGDWELPEPGPFPGPLAVLAGRLDSVVGFEAAAALALAAPRATLVVADDAGHALPHERPDLLRAALADWLERCARP